MLPITTVTQQLKYDAIEIIALRWEENFLVQT